MEEVFKIVDYINRLTFSDYKYYFSINTLGLKLNFERCGLAWAITPVCSVK